MDVSAPFKGLKVLELASVLAGPSVGLFFAELGAEVIKIENKNTGGDVTRKWKLPSEKKQSLTSAYYCSINFKKTVLFIDLNDETDRAKVTSLIGQSDIVLSNYRANAAKRFGLDYESVKRLKPDIIFGHIYGFGKGNTTPAFDVVLQAESGFLYMTGELGKDPVKMPVALIDILAGHQLKEAVLIALLRKANTGEGAFVSVSLYDAAIASLSYQASNFLMAGHLPQPAGSLHPNIAPYGEIMKTADQQMIVLAVGTDRQFQALCTCLNLSDLKENPDFRLNTDRVKNREKLRLLLQNVFTTSHSEEIMKKLSAHHVPAGRILNLKQVFEQPAAREMVIRETMHDGTVAKVVKSVAFSFEVDNFDEL